MKKNLFILISVFCVTTILAQTNYITLQTGNNVINFTDLQAAVDSALSGDTIFLNGGTKTIGNVIIDKELHLVGVGHYPDYSVASGGKTDLSGDIKLLTGSSNSSINGIEFDNFSIGTTQLDDSIQNLIIENCKISQLFLGVNGIATSSSSNITISKNVINVLLGSYAQNVMIKNNIIYGNSNINIGYFNGNAIFSNNIFSRTSGSYFLANIYNCTFENNVILLSTSATFIFYGLVSNNFFNNNLSTISEPYNGISGYGTGVNNINNVSLSDITISGNYPFGYSYDYHLKQSCIGIGYGTDGTDVGIYGSSDPYTDGALPSIPHFESATIGSSTNANGELLINISVSAQP
ncbi:MAG: hypothetical protein K9H64_22005 [Bacteroidales bacterium]|nr:hypothetical protein [Bacteroidales bacterium]MCF8458710.1 hypothetical protein [Bacteroidales bacterium]